MSVSPGRGRRCCPSGEDRATGAGPGQAVSHVQGAWSNEEALAVESQAGHGAAEGGDFLCWRKWPTSTVCPGRGGGVIDHVEGEGLMAAAVGTAV